MSFKKEKRLSWCVPTLNSLEFDMGRGICRVGSGAGGANCTDGSRPVVPPGCVSGDGDTGGGCRAGTPGNDTNCSTGPGADF